MREADGLALSSRNAHLSPAERRIAPHLSATLFAAANRIAEGAPVGSQLAAGRAALLGAGFRDVEYLELRAAEDLQPLPRLDRPARLLAAAWLAHTRLIDLLEELMHFAEDHEEYELDEILTVSLILSVAVAVFAVRRIQEFKHQWRRRMEAEGEIHHMAYHDALTGLPNRVSFGDHLVKELARARRAESMVAVMCLDLDRFKQVNDRSPPPARRAAAPGRSRR